MGLDGSQGQKELIGDFLIGIMQQQQLKDFAFSLRELVSMTKALNQYCLFQLYGRFRCFFVAFSEEKLK